MQYLKLFLVIISTTSCGETKAVILEQPAPLNDTAYIEKIPDVIQLQENDNDYSVNLSTLDSTTSKNYDANLQLKELHKVWDNLLQKHVSEKGRVDYKGFRKDHSYLRTYISNLRQNIPANDSDKADKLAFWINAYNALTIDLILRNYPLNSIKDIRNPWDQRLWKFQDKFINLNDIEHNILRTMNEPRIHFAIVCASISCPKLLNKAYNAESLDLQLSKATKNFLADSTRNELSESKIKISKIFKWFKKDFEQDRSLIDFLNAYSNITLTNTTKISYKDYNWNLNN